MPKPTAFNCCHFQVILKTSPCPFNVMCLSQEVSSRASAERKYIQRIQVIT
jgi:hypothetical protein